MPDIAIHPLTDADHEWVKEFIMQRWGSPIMIGHGVIYTISELPGFVADREGEHVGLLTYNIQGRACEIVSLDSTRPGVGTALMKAIKAYAQQEGCTRLWLVTTNDNLHALRFYQKRGYVLVAVHRDAVTQARKLKPQIPLLGNDDIPIRDEIELELLLS
ncbi:MAG TPA: GNAT family N-acetyltransferase [Ktedonobacteraceae bacterium]|nr:GNAT family N-acetyltransferase [Ktedonobacteraceae bacterium]